MHLFTLDLYPLNSVDFYRATKRSKEKENEKIKYFTSFSALCVAVLDGFILFTFSSVDKFDHFGDVPCIFYVLKVPFPEVSLKNHYL